MFKLLLAAACLAVIGVPQVEARDWTQGFAARTLGTYQPLPLPKSNVCNERTVGGVKRMVCVVEVSVSDQPNCRPEVKPGTVLITYTNASGIDRQNYFLVWKLTLRALPVGGNLDNLSFEPDTGIDIVQDLNAQGEPRAFSLLKKSDENGVENTALALPHHVVRVRSQQTSAAPVDAAAYHYNVAVRRKNAVGEWVQCGAIDPLIVNTD